MPQGEGIVYPVDLFLRFYDGGFKDFFFLRLYVIKYF